MFRVRLRLTCISLLWLALADPDSSNNSDTCESGCNTRPGSRWAIAGLPVCMLLQGFTVAAFDTIVAMCQCSVVQPPALGASDKLHHLYRGMHY